MNFALREQLLIMGVAVFNGVFVYPYVKKAYRQFYTLREKPTHFVRSSLTQAVIV